MEKIEKYTVLLADADDTLLDFAAAEGKALRAACAAMGLAIGDAQAQQYKEINAALWRAFQRNEITQEALKVLRFERFLAALGVSADPAELAEHFVGALSLQTDEIGGAREFLREASARVPVVIVTNGIARVQRSRFGLSPLSAHITDFIISGERGFAKPDPRMIWAAIEAAGVPDARPLMLGDEPTSDIAAARAAGVDSCWFNPSGRENTTLHLPTLEVRALREVLQWL
ncbi:noncanonical pyrimidine nucleotidase, YjjG family protein [Clostridia bacterium]|nr:noncanonical pyrimidine nucleotidase, YjjG family protein [Clostridia bacterium]